MHCAWDALPAAHRSTLSMEMSTKRMEGVISIHSVTRILVADDFAEWRQFITAEIEHIHNWCVVGQAADGFEAVSQAKELQPDLILLDVSMPKLDGLTAAKRISLLAPKSKILFVSQDLNPDVARAAFKVGGHGYVLKSEAATDLFPAVEAVMLGKKFVSPRLREYLI
jgi:DNA-binding NarL/FixJ family response regulator